MNSTSITTSLRVKVLTSESAEKPEYFIAQFEEVGKVYQKFLNDPQVKNDPKLKIARVDVECLQYSNEEMIKELKKRFKIS